jgi:hypothetical protein
MAAELGLLALVLGGCETEREAVPAAVLVRPTDTPAEATPEPTTSVAPAKPAGSEPASAAAAPLKKKADTKAEPSLRDAAAALKHAANRKKYLFLLFYEPGDERGEQICKTFVAAEKALGSKALFYAADVSDDKEQATVQQYQADQATLPLTLAIAPNGAIVKAFVGEAVDQEALAKSFVSAKLAEVQKALQDKKMVLLCAQGKHTQHNAESLQAARAVADDESMQGGIAVVSADPDNPGSKDLWKHLKVDANLEQATVFILIPPSTLGGKVEGATDKAKLLAAVQGARSSCGDT